MSRFISPHIAATVILACSSAASAQVLNDSLNGSTIGTRSGGTFTGGGWRVDNQYDSILWHTGTYTNIAFEYNVVGLAPGSCPGGAGGKNELSHMYDFTWNNADNQYAPGYRDDPYKQYIRKQCESGKVDKLEMVLATPPDGNFIEPDSGALGWSSGANYLFRTEITSSGGACVMKIFRDGGLVFQGQVSGSWSPAGQSVRIAASSRRADEGASTGAIYSNVKVFDLTNFIPNPPTITAPTNAQTVNTQVAYIQWSGDTHTRYQVRVNNQNNPDLGIISDTGQVDTGRFFSWSGTLPNSSTVYAFVRLGTSSGWGGWSSGRQFTVNTSFNPGGTDYVTVKGNSYANNSGPFLGLGFTYMRALYNCKFQRARFTSDCAYMASKGYTYLRDLTMVEWDDLEIAPVSFTNSVGQFVPAWSDYWQQFRDSIDVAYSNGLKTEITIFASAQNVMPSDSTRTTHLNNILANIVGREHKIVLIEIANEHYQNGLPDINDVRNKAAYMAANTPIPVSLSSPADTSDGGIVGMYSGSAADVTCVHFSRDIGTQEGGWLPVRDSDRSLSGIAPLSSNEPIGAGSSVSTENDPIKLCMAACYGFTANLVSYVYHSRAGTFGWELCCPPGGQEKFFNASPGNDSYVNILPLMPKELSSWEKNDGKAGPSPFTNYSMGQANKWWTEVGGATNGCVRNISAIKNGRFVTTPIGILGGGLQIQARRPMQFKAYNPLTGGISYNQTLAANASITLAQGTGAYVIIGDFTDVPIDGGTGGGGSNTQVSINLGTTNVEAGMTHPQPSDGDTVAANIGGRDCRKNVTAGADNYFYFAVNDGYAFNGNKPNHWIRFDYYDTGTGTATLEYDGASAAYTNGGTITYTNSNTWKTATFNVVDAYFGNRQNNGADFRLSRGVTFYLDTVYVYVKAFSGTAIVVPATVQAEDFNNGGPGQGYNDADVGNNGGQYRLGENVDIETCSEGGFNVGWINTGEWLQYQVNVTTAGNYDFGMRVASGTSTGQYHIEMNGVNVTGTRTVTSTGGIQTWATQTVPSIALTTGVKTLRVFVDTGTGNWNFNNVSITRSQTPFGGTARAVPGIVQAEDFDDGGQGVAYSDTDSTNNGGLYRTTEGVDIEACTDTGGGFDIGWANAGEWLEYTINVTQAGDYTVQMRVASCCTNGLWHFDVDGGARTTGRGMATTGGWQNWTTISFTGVFLPAGIHVFRVLSDSDGYNFNYINFVFQGADVISVDLDQTNVNDGMTSPIGGDGDTIDTQIGGHLCRKNMDPSFNDFYYYFTVTDIYAFQGNKNAATITVDYFDTGTQSFSLQYDGTSNPYTQGAVVTLTNTNTWKTAVFQVNDAYFGNRQNTGSDFRLAGAGLNHTFYIDTVTVFCTTGGPQTISNSAFASSADGWNIVVWHVGPNLDGTMAFESGTGNPAGDMLSGASGATNNTDACTREGGEINKAISTSGFNTAVQVQYDLRLSTDQSGTTCIGTCTPLEGNCADKIAVYYSTAGTGGPWTLLEAVNALSLTQNVWSTRTINCPAAANNKPGFALRFRFQFNTAPTDSGRLDNIKVIATP